MTTYNEGIGCMAILRDLTGQRFGRLTAIERQGSTPGGRVLWRCICDCGTEKLVTRNSLTTGSSKSCGCLVKDGNNLRHGMKGTRTYNIWQCMRQRCYDSKNRSYCYYGELGIKVCDRWLNSFEAFFEDMGECPEGMSIDRIDVTKNYTPENCRWANAKQQSNNRRNVIRYEYNGSKLTLPELSDLTGLPYDVLKSRVRKHGWSIEKAVTTPHKKNNRVVNYQGQNMSLADLSRITNVDYSLLSTRLKRGWTIEDAVVKPTMRKSLE